MNNKSTDANDANKTKTETKVSKPKAKKQPKTFLDILTKSTRFPEFRGNRKFTEFIFAKMFPIAAQKCLEIKRKYDLIGKPVSPDMMVEIIVKEGIILDTENGKLKENEAYQISRTDDGDLILFFNPKLTVKQGKQFLYEGFAGFAFAEYVDLYFTKGHYKTLDDVVTNPDLMIAIFTADVLAAMLQSSESEAELLALAEKEGLKPKITLTADERRKVDRQAVALWLHKASNQGTPAIQKLVDSLLTEIEGDTQALNSPEHIENVLAKYDEIISENRYDRKALEAAGVLFKLATNPQTTGEEISSQMVNIADFWLNPEGGIFSDAPKSETEEIAILLNKVMGHSKLPRKLFDDILYSLNEIYNSLSAKQNHDLVKAELSPEYLTELFESHEADKEEKQVLDLSEVCAEFLGTNEATAGEKRIPLASLLSAVMKHPDMPKRIYNVLSDEIVDLPEGFYEQPETIQLTLERLKSEEGEK